MDKHYADTVRLVLNIAPDVFDNDIFAMKGGTAINLFLRDMPRLSVDIDVVYRPWQTPRDQALQAINQELAAIAQRVERLRVQTRLIRSKDLRDPKQIGRAHVCTPVTNAQLVCRLLLVKKSYITKFSNNYSNRLALFHHKQTQLRRTT